MSEHDKSQVRWKANWQNDCRLRDNEHIHTFRIVQQYTRSFSLINIWDSTKWMNWNYSFTSCEILLDFVGTALQISHPFVSQIYSGCPDPSTWTLLTQMTPFCITHAMRFELVLLEHERCCANTHRVSLRGFEPLPALTMLITQKNVEINHNYKSFII